jgi:hypothetical protein
MVNSFQNYNAKIKKLVIFFFFSYFFLGLSIVGNYGISIDEETSRLNALINGNYILKKFLSKNEYDKIFENITNDKFSEKIRIKKPQNLDTYPDRAYGVIFELPVTALEFIFNIKKTKHIYLLRHIANFLFFFISLLFFFKLLNKIFKKDFYSLFGCILLITLPRIFGEIFYNSKDIIFLSLFIISNYYGYSIILKKNNKNLFLFCFFSACAINIRIIGAIIPFLVVTVLFVDSILKNKYTIKKEYILIPVLTFFFLYIITPFLWWDPINNFIYTFTYSRNHLWPHFNFYLGEFIKASQIPWHYIFVWFFITTPLFHLFTFLVGLIIFFFKIKSYFKNKSCYVFFIFILYLFLPVFVVIIFNSTLYDGLRHFYFVFPFLIIFSIIGITFLLSYRQNIVLKSIYVILFLLFFLNIFQLVKIHPHQYLYFNNIFVKNSLLKFEKDYWALSNKIILEKFLKKVDDKQIVYSFTGSMLPLSIQFLDEKDQKKFIFYGNIKKKYQGPVYLFANNRYQVNYENIKLNAETVYEFNYDDVIINGVYKFKNTDSLKNIDSLK